MIRLVVILPILLGIYMQSGLATEPADPMLGNQQFFAPQSPLQFSQTDDGEWGASAPSGSLSRTPSGYKSPSQALLYSFLLPGLGEIYVGDSRTKAIGFMTAEVGIWSTFVLFRHLGKWKKDDFREFAVANSGVDPTGKDDQFWDMIGFHTSRDDYNKVSRVYSRDNPFYPETPDWDWQWSSDSQQREYRDIKNDSKTYYRNANFTLAAAALNRVVSMFYAWRSARGHNRKLIDEFSNINFDAVPDPTTGSIELRIAYSRIF